MRPGWASSDHRPLRKTPRQDGGPAAQSLFSLRVLRNKILRMRRNRNSDEANTQETFLQLWCWYRLNCTVAAAYAGQVLRVAQALRRPVSAATVAAAVHEEVGAASASITGQQAGLAATWSVPGISYVRCVEDSPGTGPE